MVELSSVGMWGCWGSEDDLGECPWWGWYVARGPGQQWWVLLRDWRLDGAGGTPGLYAAANLVGRCSSLGHR